MEDEAWCGELELRLRGSGLVEDYSEAKKPTQLLSYRIISQSTLSSERIEFRHSHIFVLHFNRGIKSLNFFPVKMVTLKEYEAYLRGKRIIDSCDEAEIISTLSNERNYTPMIIESEGISPTKHYST